MTDKRGNTRPPAGRFIVLAVTRQEIADELSNALSGLTQSAGDSAVTPRQLTDAFCRNFAKRLGDIYEDSVDNDEEWFIDATANLHADSLRELGHAIPEEQH